MCEIQPLLITDKQPAIRIDFKPCKVKPNHTTYEHPKGLVWQPFTSSFTRCHVVPQPMVSDPYLLTPGGEPAAFRLDHQFHALSEGGHPVWAYDALNPQNTACYVGLPCP